MDARQAEALEQVVAARPTSVILDITDAEAACHCPWNKMFNALPRLKIIGLDPSQAHIQVVTGQHYPLTQVKGVLEVIHLTETDEKGDLSQYLRKVEP